MHINITEFQERSFIMKTKLALFGALMVIILSAILDSPPTSNEQTIYYEMQEDESVDADTQPTERSASSSFEFMLEDMNERNGKIIETYREYEVHKDTEGNIISRIPTDNYQYLQYDKD